MASAPGMDNMIYFAYGANLCRAHMALWCPEAVPVGGAWLPGHRLVFRTWVDVSPSPGDAVPGALYQLGPRDLPWLDTFQDCPALYVRTRLAVATPRGPTSALVYRMAPGRTLALPDEDYLNLLLQGYADWNLAPGILAALAGV